MIIPSCFCLPSTDDAQSRSGKPLITLQEKSLPHFCQSKPFILDMIFPSRLIPQSLIMLVLFSSLFGCGPVLQPIEKDRQIGLEAAEQVEIDMGLYDDRDSTEFLQQVGQRLAKHLPEQNFEYQFAIVNQSVPNAFTLPGGYIYVSRGLLALTNSEDELATVLGHEIIHASHRHSARQMAKARMPKLLALPGAVVGGVVSENLGNLLLAPVAVLGGGYLAYYGRQDEFEADQFGQLLAADAGYNPAALATILTSLEKYNEAYTGEERIPGFFDTHPTTPDRLARVIRDALTIEWEQQTGVAGDNSNYLRWLDGLLVGDDPAMGVLMGNKFLHPELKLQVKFPQNWEPLNTQRAIVAIAPENDGLIMFGVEGEGTDPKVSAEKLKEALFQSRRLTPKRFESLSINDLPAHLLTYSDTHEGETIHMHFLWIAYQGKLYQFVGLAPDRYQPLLKETALSFRPITSKEMGNIREQRLQVVAAHSGETLEHLSRRTGNTTDLNITAIINQVRPEEKLAKGRLIKITTLQPYSGR